MFMYVAMFESDNPYISYIAKVVTKCKTSRLNVNLDLICKQYLISDRNVIEWYHDRNKAKPTSDEYHCLIAGMIRELRECKLDYFSNEEITSLLVSDSVM